MKTVPYFFAGNVPAERVSVMEVNVCIITQSYQSIVVPNMLNVVLW